jgi:hypothetical protein
MAPMVTFLSRTRAGSDRRERILHVRSKHHLKTHLKAHIINTHDQHIFSKQLLKTPSQNTFSKQLFKTAFQNSFSKQLLKTASQTLTTACVSV